MGAGRKLCISLWLLFLLVRLLVVRDFCFAIPVSGVRFRYSWWAGVPGNPVPRPDMKPCKHLYPVCKRIVNGILIKNKGFVVFDIGLAGSQMQQAFFSKLHGDFYKLPVHIAKIFELCSVS